MAACVEHFSGSEIPAQGDSYMRFSLTFWHVKLGRCLEFSPLTAPAPQLPSEIFMRNPYPLGGPLGYFLHLPSSNFSVRKFPKAWPQLLWLTRVYKAQQAANTKVAFGWVQMSLCGNSGLFSSNKVERRCLYLFLSLFSTLNYLLLCFS